MAADSFGSKKQPHYAGSGVPQDAADLTEVADYAAQYGNYRVGTQAEFNNLASDEMWPGLEFYVTDTDALWVRRATNIWQQRNPDPTVAVSGTQGSGAIGGTGQIGDISRLTFNETAARTVLVTLTTTSSAGSAASGNLYLRLNGQDVITPATARQHRLAAGTQNFIALTTVAKTAPGSNTLAFAATSDPGGAVITFDQIALGAKAF